jgi:hypothetical protein
LERRRAEKHEKVADCPVEDAVKTPKVERKPIGTDQEGTRKLKAEWWEIWWDRPGTQPIFVPMYGQPIPWWIPDGCYPSRDQALHEKRRRNNKFDRIIHVRRYQKVR